VVGDVELSELEEKKKALIAEAEVYRQTLKLEIQNVRLYGAKARRAVGSFSFSNPLLVIGATLAGTLLKQRSAFKLRAATVTFMAWQIYQRLVIPIRGMFFRKRSRARTRDTSQAYERASVEEI
jgi:hypothetical protein